MGTPTPSPRALLAAHVVALLRGRLRASPAHATTALVILAGGRHWDVVNVRLVADRIVLDARPREVPG